MMDEQQRKWMIQGVRSEMRRWRLALRREGLIGRADRPIEDVARDLRLKINISREYEQQTLLQIIQKHRSRCGNKCAEEILKEIKHRENVKRIEKGIEDEKKGKGRNKKATDLDQDFDDLNDLLDY